MLVFCVVSGAFCACGVVVIAFLEPALCAVVGSVWLVRVVYSGASFLRLCLTVRVLLCFFELLVPIPD